MAGAEPPEQGMQVYAAFSELVGLIESIVLRSRRDRWQLPLLCLVSEPPGESSLAAMDYVCAGDVRRVPHVLIDATGKDLRTLLHKAYVGLSTGAFGVKPLRFRHYALAEWLMTVNVSRAPANKRRTELARKLRHDVGLSGHGNAQSTPPGLSGWAGMLWWLALTVLPAAMFRLLTTGWLLGAGRQFRWFMRQQYLAPRLSGDFLTFATRLTVKLRDSEDQEQINLLLVHAFLQDLRVQFRRRPWRLAAWRRTAYPVLLVNNISPDNGGYPLVQKVNAVRDDTGQSDPLLIIVNSPDVPPDGLAADDPAVTGQLVPLTAVEGAYRAWYGELPRARRARRDNAWYLRVRVPPADLRPFIPMLPRIVPPKPPWLLRRGVLVALLVAMLLGGGGWQIPGLIQQQRADCAWPPLRTGGLVHTVVRGGQCIGYSDHERQVFSKDSTLIAIQEKIFQQNRDAEAAWRVRRDRPFVTLIYFGSLTKPDALAGEETFAGEREELQGMAAAQYRAFLEARENRADPYLRIVVANAAQEMEYSPDVVKMLTELAGDDTTVLGVIGLVESRKVIKGAIRDLADAGLPVIAPTLSADGIADASNKYLQISAPNLDEAQLVYNHTTQVLNKTKIFNYYTYGAASYSEGEQNDLYVNTLREDLREKFGADYTDSFWTLDVDLRSACPDNFPDGVVFFGGRYGDFGAFANKLASDCSGNPPLLIGDDSVNRYMANAELRLSAPENLPVAYVAKGALAYCDQLTRAGDYERSNFRSDVRSVLSLCMSDTAIGERVGLAYDATRMVLRAVKQIASSIQSPSGGAWNPDEITPTGVHARIRELANPYRGVTGFIRFNANGVPIGKRLTILCVPNIKIAFHTPGDVPKEIDRFPDSPEEDTVYGTPTPDRRACAAS